MVKWSALHIANYVFTIVKLTCLYNGDHTQCKQMSSDPCQWPTRCLTSSQDSLPRSLYPAPTLSAQCLSLLLIAFILFFIQTPVPARMHFSVFISRSPDPVATLTRFMVGPMTVNKGKKVFLELEHKLLSFKVDDDQTKLIYDFFIEHNGTNPRALPASTRLLGATVSIVSTSTVGSTATVSTSSTVALESVARVAHHQTSGQETVTTTPPRFIPYCH